jgi:hypothetical protein
LTGKVTKGPGGWCETFRRVLAHPEIQFSDRLRKGLLQGNAGGCNGNLDTRPDRKQWKWKRRCSGRGGLREGL